MSYTRKRDLQFRGFAVCVAAAVVPKAANARSPKTCSQACQPHDNVNHLNRLSEGFSHLHSEYASQPTITIVLRDWNPYAQQQRAQATYVHITVLA